MARLSASSKMMAWTLDEHCQLAISAVSIGAKAVADNVLDRDGESRVCSWKCGGTGGVARLFMMTCCGLTSNSEKTEKMLDVISLLLRHRNGDQDGR